MTSLEPQVSGDTFSHHALFYEGVGDYLRGVLPFVQEGLTAGEAALVAVPAPRIDLLRAGLDGSEARVTFIDMAELGRNPARIIPAVRRFTDTHPGRRTRFVGEPIWPGRSLAETREAARHEALLNVAFADSPTAILCPYDSARLDEVVLADAWRTHPQVTERGEHRPSPSYVPFGVLDGDQSLSALPAHAEVLVFGAGDLAQLRRLVEERARRSGLDPDRVQPVVTAVNELATNSLVHGGGTGVLRIWDEDGGLRFQVEDRGHITDPLVGRTKVEPGASSGHGLSIVHQLCDLVELRSSPEGTIVRIHVEPA